MNFKQVKRKSKLPAIKVVKDVNFDQVFKKWENLIKVK
jgi:hypothetical protein